MCALNTIDAHKVYIGPKGFLGRNVSTVDSRLPVRSQMRSDRHYGRFFSPNSFSVKAISKAITNAVRLWEHEVVTSVGVVC